MKHRNIVVVIALSVLTLGVYFLVWTVKTKNEMNERGAALPTAWLLLVPFVNIWWSWRYCRGVEFVTNGHQSAIVALLLMVALPVVGQAVVQDAFNNVVHAPERALAV